MTNLDNNVIFELRALATDGARVPELLAFLSSRLGNDAAYMSNIVKYFMKAFYLPLRSLALIGAWSRHHQFSNADDAFVEAIHQKMLETKPQWSLRNHC